MIRKATQAGKGGGTKCGNTEWQEVSEVMWHDACHAVMLSPSSSVFTAQGVLTWPLGIRWKYYVGSIDYNFKRSQQISTESSCCWRMMQIETYLFSNIRTWKVASVCWAGPALTLKWGRSSGAGARPEAEENTESGDSHRVRPSRQPAASLSHFRSWQEHFRCWHSFMLEKSCLLQHSYSFYAIENSSKLLQHSFGLLGPDDSDSHQRVSGVICDTDPSVILSLMTDTGSWHSSVHHRGSWPLLRPPRPLYLEGITQEHWIGISHQSDIVVNLSSRAAPAVTRRPGSLGVISDWFLRF